MKTAHWVLQNQSGMCHMAQACVAAERQIGLDAAIVEVDKPATWQQGHAIDADLHVIHTKLPEIQRVRIKNRTGRPPKMVFVSHGIPEHVFELAVQDNLNLERVDTPDWWMVLRYWLREADAVVVFNARQQALFQTMVHKGTPIDLVPMAVDRAFWSKPGDQPHLHGQPALWNSENQHRIKWALDLILAWPFVLREMPGAHLHGHQIPLDLHRWMIDLANTNGAAFGATLSQRYFTQDRLKQLWGGCDFLFAATRYGDNTLITQQAESMGLPVISYRGNQHASFWVTEGDQREMAAELCRIFRGEQPPRADKLPVPDLPEMGRAMQAVYERVLS